MISDVYQEDFLIGIMFILTIDGKEKDGAYSVQMRGNPFLSV